MKLCPKCQRRVYEHKPGSLVEYLCPWMDCGRAGWNDGYGKEGIIPVDGDFEQKYEIENNKPLFSLIIAYAYSKDLGRQRGLDLLLKTIKKQTIKDYEVIVVEQVMDNNLNGYFPYKDQVTKHIPIKDPQNRAFNKSWVMNVGARTARSENLIFHDADVVFGHTFLEKVLQAVPYYPLFRCWSTFIAMSGKDNPFIRIHNHRSISCLIAAWYCNKYYYFNALGGYNESYFGYGREDNDIWVRASYISNKFIPLIDYTVIHSYHDWHPPTGANPYNAQDDEGNSRLDYTNKNPKKVIELLKKGTIGDLNSPYIIPLTELI